MIGGKSAVERFDLWSRRELIRLGSIGLGGLTLSGLNGQDREARGAAVGSKAKIKSVVLLFLSGGPAHQDMWDLKPNAPEEIRGTFRPIDTAAPGVRITEHMPRMARLADKYVMIRSMHHAQGDHPAAAYWMMVGSRIARPATNAAFMSRDDRPHPGSVAAKLLGSRAGMPPFVLLPEAMAPNGPERAGQHAGFLGAAFDPYRVDSDPNSPNFSPGVISLPAELSLSRLRDRRALLAQIGRQTDRLLQPDLSDELHEDYARAFDLLTSTAVQRAFDIESESSATRDRYGRHVFGQSTLLARRMVEAGVRLTQVNWVRHDNGKGGQGYDSHADHLNWAKTELLPPTDAAFSSLVEDLDDRGLLDETLVIMMGEFGRTPRFNKAGGRDHWPHCFSVVLAGGGIQGGQAFGSSDKIAAYPVNDPVTPDDLIATLYLRLGIDPKTWIHDRLNRPFALVEGQPLTKLF